MSEVKTIEVKLEGVIYTIQFKDTQPKETIVFDDTGKEYFRNARALLREKAKQLGMSENGYLYNSNGVECITNDYFNKIYKYINS